VSRYDLHTTRFIEDVNGYFERVKVSEECLFDAGDTRIVYDRLLTECEWLSDSEKVRSLVDVSPIQQG
jgi:hypothetical protein